MKAVITIDGYVPIAFEIGKLVTLDVPRTVVEFEGLKSGDVRLILSKSLLKETHLAQV